MKCLGNRQETETGRQTEYHKNEIIAELKSSHMSRIKCIAMDWQMVFVLFSGHFPAHKAHEIIMIENQ